MSKNVSNNFKNIIKAGGPFYSYVIMTLSNGTEITLTSENDFTVSGTGYSEGGESGFPLGSAVSKSVTLRLDNTTMTGALQDVNSDNILDTQNDEIITQENSLGNDYYYSRFTLYTEADLPDGTTERIQEGVFTVIDSVAPGDVLEITGYDAQVSDNGDGTQNYHIHMSFTSLEGTSLTFRVIQQTDTNESTEVLGSYTLNLGE